MTHKKHIWGVTPDGNEGCSVCNQPRDQVAARRSRSSVRLGKDVERRLAKRFGWRKVGQFGDAVDLLGQTVKVQSKATRSTPPVWLAAVNGIAGIDGAPDYIEGPMAKMDPLYPGHFPVLALSYVQQGVPTTTYLVVRYEDFVEWWGQTWLPPLPVQPTHLVMEGWYWLEMAGTES